MARNTFTGLSCLGSGSKITGESISRVRCLPVRLTAKIAEEGLEPLDPDLAQLIEAWPTLPPAIREAILRSAE